MVRHVNAWHLSGLTPKQYALPHDIPFNRLRNWIPRVSAPATRTDFIPAQVITPTSREASVMLHLPRGISLSCSLVIRGLTGTK
ncbi:IS66 family insertion sequence element accessory protein TnpA [Serratia symbiotica]|uniref:IS66 family insertion sequence element accessory protein TnpA n=1 Tax=Serratia symbiotica TaxID=138074 RepID=UPI0004ABFA5F|nr:Putative diadenosine tetraphosphatase (modular protein) [Serratia symbiotica]